MCEPDLCKPPHDFPCPAVYNACATQFAQTGMLPASCSCNEFAKRSAILDIYFYNRSGEVLTLRASTHDVFNIVQRHQAGRGTRMRIPGVWTVPPPQTLNNQEVFFARAWSTNTGDFCFNAAYFYVVLNFQTPSGALPSWTMERKRPSTAIAASCTRNYRGVKFLNVSDNSSNEIVDTSTVTIILDPSGGPPTPGPSGCPTPCPEGTICVSGQCVPSPVILQEPSRGLTSLQIGILAAVILIIFILVLVFLLWWWGRRMNNAS